MTICPGCGQPQNSFREIPAGTRKTISICEECYRNMCESYAAEIAGKSKKERRTPKET